MKQGFSIIEIIIGAALITLSVTAIIVAAHAYVRVSVKNTDLTQAALLTEEAGEALQIMRDISWSSNIGSLSLNTTYDLLWNGTQYVATTTPSTINSKYRRTVMFRSVQRNSGSSISTSGTTDTNTRRAIVTITLLTDSTTLLTSELLIHNTYGN